MEIKWQSGAIPLLSSNLPKSVGELLLKSKGTLIEALVTAVKQGPASIELSLEIPSLRQSLQVSTTQSFPVGARLAINIDQQKHLHLVPLDQAPPSSPELLLSKQSLRECLPLSKELFQALSTLIPLMNQKVSADIPPSVRQAISELIAKLPNQAAVSTAEGLRQAVRLSGIGFEHLLASDEAGSVEADLKATLLRTLGCLLTITNGSNSQGAGTPAPPVLPPLSSLLNLFKPASFGKGVSRQEDDSLPILKEIVTQLAGAIANIQSRQLAQHLPSTSPDANTLVFAVELPVQGEHSLQPMSIRVEREPKRPEQPGFERAWILTLQIDLTRLGPLHARIVWRSQCLNATLWAQQPMLLDMLVAHAEELRDKLCRAGVEVNALECLPGSPTNPLTKLTTRLVDVRT